MNAKVEECVNPEFLKITFLGISNDNFKISFFEEKLKPRLLKIDEVKGAQISRPYGRDSDAALLIELTSREHAKLVFTQLKPVLEEVFDIKMSLYYKELGPTDYL